MATDDFMDIAKWAQEAKQQAVVGSADKARRLFSDVVRYSPEPEGGVGPTGRYSTGRFIANWNVGVAPRLSTTTSIDTKGNKIAEIVSIINDDFFLQYDVAFMTNALNYAKNVEYEGWKLTGPYRPIANATGLFEMAGPAPVARAIANNL